MCRPMPALINQRQERFCQLVKQGVPPIRAYPMAGYNEHESAPYRLCGNVRIKRRIAELTKGLAMKTRVTVESVTTDLRRIAEGAEADKQFGAAKGAVETMAKLHGLLVDRKESGGPGEFAGLTSAEDVLALVRTELGDDTAAVLAAALARQDKAEEQEAEQPAPTVDLVDDTPRDPGAALN